ncbi:MAG TPA: glycosyltransferase family 39 protein [Methylomirabilota bacterium]|nr:glycosyltransferase family 39 protein [Methylomirabilota bacterium]
MRDISATSVAAAKISPGVASLTKIDRTAAAGLLALLALLLLATYFTPHIWHHGEAREGLVIQDIVGHHRWILPLRSGEVPSKPILYHWVASCLALLFGLSDFIVRLPSVIGAALLAGATYTLAAFGTGKRIGLLAVGILAATFEFWDSGTEARVDMLFAALITLTLAAWYAWYRTGCSFARALAYLAVALAVLTKGPAGAVLPALVIVCFLLSQRQLAKLGEFFSWRWLLIVLAIDLGWYGAAYERGGPAFWEKQIVFENLKRFFGAAEFDAQRSRAADSLWLVTQLFPWSLLLFSALFRRLRGLSQDRFGSFLHAWWSAIFVFFLLAAGRRAVYLLPIYPAVATLAAREGATLLGTCQRFLDARGRRLEAWTLAALAVALMDMTLAVATPISRTLEEDQSDQEEFFEEVIPKIPASAPLYAAPEFPATALKVLDYRLKRDIPLRSLKCRGDYYYLAARTPQAACPAKITVVAARGGRQPLQLWHVEMGR